jgi:ABC-type Fe3+/spermidine/putrescine transport system ATPase subunit
MIKLQHLGLRRGSFSLRDIDLAVNPGECLVVVGPSGAGKTLLVESILGLQRPDRGQVLVDGEDITRLAPERRGFSYLPQDLALFPHLGVYHNIAFSRHGRRWPHEQVDRSVREAAGLLGIDHLLGRRTIASLSGGEKQRVALARALVAEPRALFLDEPFSALDGATRTDLYRQIQELRRKVRLTIMLVTHDYDEAFVLGDRMALMVDGQILQVGAPREIYDRPATTAVARLLLVENLLSAEYVRPGSTPGTAVYRVDGLEIHGPTLEGCGPGQPCWLGIRARHLRLGEPGLASADAHLNRFEVKVRATRPRPDGLLYEIAPTCASERVLQAAVSDTSGCVPRESGARLSVVLPLEHILVFDGAEARSDRQASGGNS